MTRCHKRVIKSEMKCWDTWLKFANVKYNLTTATVSWLHWNTMSVSSVITAFYLCKERIVLCFNKAFIR